MKTFSLAALATSAALASSAAFADSKTYDLEGFNGVSVATGIKAIIEVGDDYSITAESSAKGLDRLEVRVDDDGELKLRRRHRGMSWGRADQVKITITMPKLKSIDSSSGAHVFCQGVDANDFYIDASSGSHIKVAGSCKNLDVDVSSGAHVKAGKLKCATVTADASSGASASVYAAKSIEADASSGGSVRVAGGPDKIYKDTSSGGRVAFYDK